MKKHKKQKPAPFTVSGCACGTCGAKVTTEELIVGWMSAHQDECRREKVTS